MLSQSKLIERFLNEGEDGEASSLSLRRGVIYSYSEPIAYRIGLIVFLNDVHYSPTTSAHQQAIRWGVWDKVGSLPPLVREIAESLGSVIKIVECDGEELREVIRLGDAQLAQRKIKELDEFQEKIRVFVEEYDKAKREKRLQEEMPLDFCLENMYFSKSLEREMIDWTQENCLEWLNYFERKVLRFSDSEIKKGMRPGQRFRDYLYRYIFRQYNKENWL